eukprot:6540216-Alexandrium_andersonii.AAC.1
MGRKRPRARRPQKHFMRASVHGSGGLPGGRLRRALGGPSGARTDLAVELVTLEHGLGHLGDALAQVR